MYRFATYAFDADTGELSGERGAQRLQPKPARLLVMLLESGGDLVEREDIRAELWPDTNVDFDAGLNTCIRQIRTAISDTGDDIEYIETLPKRGYRITVEVLRSVAAPAPAGRSTALRPALLTVSVVGMLIAAAAGWQISGAPASEAAETTEAAMDHEHEPARLAVVPFVDPLSDANAAFNRDLAEAFVVALVGAAPQEFVVIGPSTTAEFFNGGESLPAVAAAVDAQFVLHGGYRSSAGIFFVEVVFADGAHLYAQRMQLDLSATAEAPAAVVAAMTDSIITGYQR